MAVWSGKKSTLLSLIVTVVFLIAALAVMGFGPSIITWYLSVSGNPDSLRAVLLWAVYTTCPVGIAALILLLQLLLNIRAGKVFVARNVSCLRAISWCCALLAALLLAEGCSYLPLLFLGAAAAFVFLILRVIKNVMAAAVELQSDHELTI